MPSTGVDLSGSVELWSIYIEISQSYDKCESMRPGTAEDVYDSQCAPLMTSYAFDVDSSSFLPKNSRNGKVSAYLQQ